MDKIYKYSLSLTAGAQSIALPQDAEIVHFDMQGDTPCIWVRIDPFATVQQTRQFWIMGTGSYIKDNLKYIGTVMYSTLVWHLYELEYS